MSQLDKRLLDEEEVSRNHGTPIDASKLSLVLGYEVIPPEGTVPKQIIMDSISSALMKKLSEAGCTYTGVTNDLGERHGKGKITYVDGSTYEGSFFNGLKHGHGVTTNKEGTYSGQYAHDMKDGQGELTMHNGDILKGNWKNDKKDGKFLLIKKDSGKKIQTMFYNDVEFNLADQNPDNFDGAYINLFFIVFSSAFFYLTQWVEDPAWVTIGYIFSPLLLFAYFIEAFSYSKTWTYLSNTKSCEDIIQYIEQGRKQTPVIEWTIECFHATGKNQRKLTHRAVQRFAFYECVDKTPDSSTLEYFKRYPFVRMQFSMNAEYTPPATHSYEYQVERFLKQNTQDKYQNFSVDVTFKGLMKDVTMLNGKRPFFFQTFFYAIFTMIGLSWFYRIIFTCCTRRVKLDFHKLILK